MSRNRILYQSEAIFISSGVATGFMFTSGNSGQSTLLQIQRAQSFSHDFTINRQDINQMGNLARIDSIITDAPTVNASLQYYPTDGANESKLGLYAKGTVSCLSGILSKATDPKNLFCVVTPEGSDAANNTAYNSMGVVSLGNASISNLTWNFSVGAIPTCDVTFEALNVKYDTGSQNISTPAVNLENGRPITGVNFSIPAITAGTGAGLLSALKPGDVFLSLDNRDATALGIFMSGANAVPVQSASISIPLARENLNRLGSLFSFAKVETYPITPTVQIEVFATDLKTSALSDVLCNDQFTNFSITCKEPNCSGAGDVSLKFNILNAKLESQNFSNAVGQNAKTVSLSYSCTISAPEDVSNGITISGKYAF
jgi:hypothetical protein